MFLAECANAHIIDGTGTGTGTGTGIVIENGSVVIRDGLIVSVTQGNENIKGVLTIDAKGKTVMPGFIEGPPCHSRRPRTVDGRASRRKYVRIS